MELKTPEDVEKMLEFWRETRDELDYWQTELHPGGHVDVRVPADSAAALLSNPLLQDLQYSVKIPGRYRLL